MDSKEGRIHPRRLKEFKLEYTVISGASPLKLLEARTLDFSVSGARIETMEQLEAGDQLSVRIEVPDLQAFTLGKDGGKIYQSMAIMCFGRVRWIEPGKEGQSLSAGIRFERITEVNRRYLSRLLEEDDKVSDSTS
jgi:PilZ domain